MFTQAPLSWLLTQLPACERLGSLLIRAACISVYLFIIFILFKYSLLLPHYQVSLRSTCQYSWILHRAQRKVTGKLCQFEAWHSSPGQYRRAARAGGPSGAKRGMLPSTASSPARGQAAMGWASARGTCSCPRHGRAPRSICDGGSWFQNLPCFVQCCVNALRGCLKFPVFV